MEQSEEGTRGYREGRMEGGGSRRKMVGGTRKDRRRSKEKGGGESEGGGKREGTETKRQECRSTMRNASKQSHRVEEGGS